METDYFSRLFRLLAVKTPTKQHQTFFTFPELREKVLPALVNPEKPSGFNALEIQTEIKTTIHTLPLAKILTHMQVDLQRDIQFHD